MVSIETYSKNKALKYLTSNLYPEFKEELKKVECYYDEDEKVFKLELGEVSKFLENTSEPPIRARRVIKSYIEEVNVFGCKYLQKKNKKK